MNNCGKGSCGMHENHQHQSCQSRSEHSCGGSGSCHASLGQEQRKTTGFFLHQIKEEIEEGFEALHDEIEELEERVIKVEKLINKR